MIETFNRPGGEAEETHQTTTISALLGMYVGGAPSSMGHCFSGEVTLELLVSGPLRRQVDGTATEVCENKATL